MEVEVSIKDGFAQSFRIISDRIHIVDIPGIEDGAHSIPIKAYIEQNIDRVIPIVLINLTQGGFTELNSFYEIMNSLKAMKIPTTIIFTKFQNHVNDIKAKLKETEDESGEVVDPIKKEEMV